MSKISYQRKVSTCSCHYAYPLVRELILLLLIVSVSYVHLYAQEIDKIKLQEKIQFTEQLLSETQEKQEQSILDLNLIDRQIKLREQLLRALNEEILEQNKVIGNLTENIHRLENEVLQIRNGYANTLKQVYKAYNAQNFWLSLLSASSLSEAYYRGVYFLEFSRYQRKQIRAIVSKQDQLEAKRRALIKSNEEKSQLISAKETEIKLLAETQLKHQVLLKSLKRKEQTYVAELDADREQLRRLIEKIDDKYGKIPEFYDVSDIGASFKEQMGFHYWPVPRSKGIIIGRFGKTDDQFGNPVQHDGIFIRTSQGQFVRSVFQGTVTGVQQIPLNGYIVIIEHGPYRSVYANLDTVSVQTGQYVGAKQPLGVVRTDTRTGVTRLNFLIYQVPDKFLDPERWIFVE